MKPNGIIDVIGYKPSVLQYGFKSPLPEADSNFEKHLDRK